MLSAWCGFGMEAVVAVWLGGQTNPEGFLVAELSLGNRGDADVLRAGACLSPVCGGRTRGMVWCEHQRLPCMVAVLLISHAAGAASY